jgi:hypothetical protein
LLPLLEWRSLEKSGLNKSKTSIMCISYVRRVR